MMTRFVTVLVFGCGALGCGLDVDGTAVPVPGEGGAAAGTGGSGPGAGSGGAGGAGGAGGEEAGCEAESCNGLDDDCDGQVDEDCPCDDGANQSCYGGPPGTHRIGACADGTQICAGNSWGDCTGDVTPTGELCDGDDNDCDGSSDEDNPEGGGDCGDAVGNCAAVEVCRDGELACVGSFVAPAPLGDPDNDGTSDAPKSLIGDAQENAAAIGGADVCVCDSPEPGESVFAEPIALVAGQSLLGGYRCGDWQRDSLQYLTHIQSPQSTGVTAGPGIGSDTVLEGFTLSVAASGADEASAVTVSDASPTIRDNSIRVGGAAHARGITIVSSTAGLAEPFIASNTISGSGVALASHYGIHVIASAPTLDANRIALGSAADAWGVRCEDAENMLVVGAQVIGGFSAASDDPTAQAGGIFCSGSSGGIVIRDAVINPMSGGPGASSGYRTYGIRFADCGGTVATVTENLEIHGGGGVLFPPLPGSAAYGVHASNGCPVAVVDNEAIVGGGAPADLKSAVRCELGSACTILRNAQLIGATASAFTSASGIECSADSCAEISDNALITAGGGNTSPPAAPQARGLLVEAAEPLVSNNRITAGVCLAGSATFSNATGVLLRDAGGTLVNNRIDGGFCFGGGAIGMYEVHGIHQLLSKPTQAFEPTVHFNTVHGGGLDDPAGTGHGLRFSAAPSSTPWGVYRNNIVNAGLQPRRHAVRESTSDSDPRIFANNDVWRFFPGDASGAMYLDEGTTPISLMLLNAMPNFGANLSADPLLVAGDPGPNEDFHIASALSPIRDMGTESGMPAMLPDLDGDVRPLGLEPEIGADEWVP